MEKAEKGKQSFLRENTLRWLWRSARGKRWYVAALLLAQTGLSLATIGYSLLFRDLIDRAAEKDQQAFLRCLGILTAVTVFQLVLRAINRWLDELSRSGIENSLKHRLFDTLLHKSYASVTQTHSAEWMNRLTSDTVVVANGLAQIIPNLGGMLVKMLGAFCVIMMLEPAFGMLIIPAGIMLMAVVRPFRPKLKRMHSEIQQSDGKLRVLLQERLDNLLIVSTFSQEKRSVDLADMQMQHHQNARMRRNRIVNICNTGFILAMKGMYLLGAAFSGIGIINGTVTFGTMTAVLQLIGQLQSPIAGLSGYVSQWYALLASAERLMEAEEFPETGEHEPVSEEDCLRFYREKFAGIHVNKLNFSYMDPEQDSVPAVTIRDLDIHIQKGEFIALIGHSGCGKSTLLKLLMCLYQPDSGSLQLLTNSSEGSRELTSADRHLFAYVPQGNQLMSGTIRQIITFYDEEKMRQEDHLWQALKIACADEFVAQLPQGLDTPLGEHGCGLSEGQIQRLAVARAIFSGRSILLLDEATSSLDEQTEARLLDNLRTMTDRTVLLVTHRPRACEICDRVVKLQSVGEYDSIGG